MVFTMDINIKAEPLDEIEDVDMSKENSTDYTHDITMEYTMPKLENNIKVIHFTFIYNF